MVGEVWYPGLVKDGLPDAKDQLHWGHSGGQPQHCLQISLQQELGHVISLGMLEKTLDFKSKV